MSLSLPGNTCFPKIQLGNCTPPSNHAQHPKLAHFLKKKKPFLRVGAPTCWICPLGRGSSGSSRAGNSSVSYICLPIPIMSGAVINLECPASAVFIMDPSSLSRLCRVFYPTKPLHEGPSHRNWCAIKTRDLTSRFSVPGSLEYVFCWRQSEGQGIANSPLGAGQRRMLSTQLPKDRGNPGIQNPKHFPSP